MKKTLLFLAAVLFSLNIFSQDITGQWSGLWNNHGHETQIIFNVKKIFGGYSVTLDSPEQNLNKTRANTIYFENSVLRVGIAKAGIEFLGSIDENNQIIGTLKQSNVLFPLILKKKIN